MRDRIFQSIIDNETPPTLNVRIYNYKATQRSSFASIFNTRIHPPSELPAQFMWRLFTILSQLFLEHFRFKAIRINTPNQSYTFVVPTQAASVVCGRRELSKCTEMPDITGWDSIVKPINIQNYFSSIHLWFIKCGTIMNFKCHINVQRQDFLCAFIML